MKNKQKILVILILSIFLIGMLCSPATASHTVKYGKYKATISDKQYKKLKKARKEGDYHEVIVKTKNKYTVKKPKYKTVTKKVWKYKKVLEWKDVWSSDWSDYTTYNYDVSYYWDHGWTWYGSTTTDEDGGHIHKYYSKFKKKVNTKVKVKNGYKKVKVPYKMEIDSDGYICVYKNNGDIVKEGYKKNY